MTKTFRLIPALLSSVILLSASYGQTEKQRIDTYVNEYKNLAIGEMIRTGIPAAVTLAQGILETGGGQSDLAALAYNHFGIKCKAEWRGETMSHDDDAKNECFRKYACVADSYKDHSDFLRTRPCYAFLFKLDPTDFEGWAKGLKKAGYATNPAYAQKLIKLIVENNLQDYTLLALNWRKQK
ncbi:MAG: glucosaminidase domain-containing protein [Segetibacter sp.]